MSADKYFSDQLPQLNGENGEKDEKEKKEEKGEKSENEIQNDNGNYNDNDNHHKDTSRELKATETNVNVLNLRENQANYTQVNDAHGANNFVGHSNDVTQVKHDISMNNKAKKEEKIVTLLDYEALKPLELLQYDKRTTLTFFKDVIVTEHSLFALLFKRSLSDPTFIRLPQLVFTLSMQFCLNAMLITDATIDQNANQPSQVTTYINFRIYSCSLLTNLLIALCLFSFLQLYLSLSFCCFGFPEVPMTHSMKAY
jgi:hypothetical protein